MENKLLSKLQEWNLASLYDPLNDQDITCDSLLLLSECTLISILPKAGPRTLLLHRINEERKLVEQQGQEQLSSSHSAISTIDQAALAEILNTSFSDDSYLPSTSLTPNTCASALCNTSNLDISGISPITHNTRPNSPFLPNHDGTGSTIPDVAGGSESCSIPVRESLLTLMKNILASHALGVCLGDKTELLAESRNLLTEIVANYMLVNIERPVKQDFMKYASAITAMFPKEFRETYYIPSQNNQTPKGKLYWKVHGLKAKMKKMNRGMKRTFNQAAVEDLSVLDKIEEVPDDVLNDAIAWLRIHNAPDSQVFDLWLKTAKTRLSYIRRSNEHTIQDIVLQWPRYRDENGFVLIDRDFAILHPTAANKFSKNWPTVVAKLWPRMQHLKDKEAKQMMANIASGDESLHVSDAVMTITLILLPSLMPETSVATLSSGKGKRRSFWKPSVAESMGYFIDVQKPGISMSEYIREKAENLEKKGLRLQPHVVALVQDTSQLENGCCFYAVITKDIFFAVSTAMIAVDICMKSFFVFDVKFPDAAKSTWLFLQRSVYEIITEHDSSGTKVLQLMSELHCAS